MSEDMAFRIVCFLAGTICLILGSILWHKAVVG